MASRCARPTPALFLDRDGVLIEDKHHLCKPQDVELCLGALGLLLLAHQSGWPVVLITNQSGIARGLFDWDDYELVTDRLLELLGPDAPLAAIYANGHGPDAPATSWRKPSPAMLLAAGQELNLDISASLLIGDRLSDLQAGAAAGLAWLGHVLSGHGQRERPRVTACIGPGGQFRGENPSSWQAQVVLLESLLDFPSGLLSPQALQPR
jgi:D-glycero-D-manno-heptose 1,7-bisphosphate phosphatase